MGNNVTAAKPKTGGAVYVAPAGTTLPTDATAALNAAFNQLGYISDSGLANTTAMNTDTIKAWGGDEVLVVYKGREDGFRYELIEATNIEVLKLVYGSENVTGTLEEGITVKVKSDVELPEVAMVVETILKDGILKRSVVPAARVTDVGDITYADGAPVGYDTTIKATPDSAGYTHYEYIKAANA